MSMTIALWHLSPPPLKKVTNSMCLCFPQGANRPSARAVTTALFNKPYFKAPSHTNGSALTAAVGQLICELRPAAARCRHCHRSQRKRLAACQRYTCTDCHAVGPIMPQQGLLVTPSHGQKASAAAQQLCSMPPDPAPKWVSN